MTSSILTIEHAYLGPAVIIGSITGLLLWGCFVYLMHKGYVRWPGAENRELFLIVLLYLFCAVGMMLVCLTTAWVSVGTIHWQKYTPDSIKTK